MNRKISSDRQLLLQSISCSSPRERQDFDQILHCCSIAWSLAHTRTSMFRMCTCSCTHNVDLGWEILSPQRQTITQHFLLRRQSMQYAWLQREYPVQLSVDLFSVLTSVPLAAGDTLILLQVLYQCYQLVHLAHCLCLLRLALEHISSVSAFTSLTRCCNAMDSTMCLDSNGNFSLKSDSADVALSCVFALLVILMLCNCDLSTISSNDNIVKSSRGSVKRHQVSWLLLPRSSWKFLGCSTSKFCELQQSRYLSVSLYPKLVPLLFLGCVNEIIIR
jgi:hypothetical protein